MRVGKVIKFGDYDWRVLKVKDDRVLLLTEHMIEQQPYHNCKGEVTWAQCSLRNYLNSDFYNCFTLNEQERILQVSNINSNNPWYESEGGEQTLDYVFLLSIEEVVCNFFGDSSKNLVSRSSKQRYWFQKKDDNNNKRMAILDGHSWWWWLRSPGRDNKRAAYIHGDGNVGIQGNGTYNYNSKNVHCITGKNYGGVRPALWIKK
ncbi:hypothetical protein F8153_15890 [Alkaliphilus serpentinus]|uniref:DUF6273 domain-containing protein n=1 Tax=Alkaliphilus serpentinus TaxID=1482731 RepID=A0A833M6R8_9FIRM|nr:hypothetical protein F8153_15890 [Alkaliphilus serpentinus]